ncbi:nucleotidyl transferase AbiEii/AbiGii toxin family protein [bacterium]|nr:nucleotidyl transferase AbiEii/AbiGii toxin family protein [bacterium]
MNPKVLPAEAWTVVRRLDRAGVLEEWILAGGTALALQLGHRVSIDLDFFRHDDFELTPLRESLADLGGLEVAAMAPGTLHCRLDGLRLTFLRSEVPFLYETTPYRGLRLADVRDIAAMKVIAVAGRGSRKDFIDLYAYLEAGASFGDLMNIVEQRYRSTEFNAMHLLRSLVYFDDAETEPMPRMLAKVAWPEIRRRLEDEARDWAP